MTYIPTLGEAGLSEMSNTAALWFMWSIFAMWVLIPTAATQGPSYSFMTYAQPVILVFVVVAMAVILYKRKTPKWGWIPGMLLLYAEFTLTTNLYAFAIGHPRAFISHARSEGMSLLACDDKDRLASILNSFDGFGNETGVFVEFKDGDWIAILPRTVQKSFCQVTWYTLARDSSGAWFECRQLSPYNRAENTDGRWLHVRPKGTILQAVQNELLHQGFTRLKCAK